MNNTFTAFSNNPPAKVIRGVATIPTMFSRDFPNAWFNVNATGRIEGYIYDRIGTSDIPIQRKLFLIRS